MLEFGVLFGLWIVFNVYFNIYNKQTEITTVGTLSSGICQVCSYFNFKMSSFSASVELIMAILQDRFHESCFMSAMASNLANQSRNVLIKKLMAKKKDAMDNISLFYIITIMSFLLLAPFAVVMEGIKFTPSYLQSPGLNVNEVQMPSLLAALCFHAYQQVAYMLLQRASPLSSELREAGRSHSIFSTFLPNTSFTH